MTPRARTLVCCIFAVLAAFMPAIGSAGTLKTLYSFPNATPTPYAPWGGLTALGGMLYGTTSEGGTGGRGSIIQVAPATGKVTLLASFTGANGESPFGGLTAADGKLYGTTYFGGSKNAGTVFSVAPSTGAITLLYAFDGSSGKNPVGSLAYAGGYLYGATYFGGSAGFGEVFRIDAATGAEKVLFSFPGGNAGAYPYGGLLYIGGTLYGTTEYGGSTGSGTIFSVDATTGKQTTLYSFRGGNDGGNPSGSLIAVGPLIYGTTEGVITEDGNSNCGTVFQFAPATGVEKVLHGFDCFSSTAGSSPEAGLIASGGVLYGTTAYGGASVGGTVFSLKASTGAITVLASVNSLLLAPLVLSGGKLYGTTYGLLESGPQIGLQTGGTVFEVPVAGGTLKTLADFGGNNPGRNANSAMIDVSGMLIGTTAQGGPSASGAVFAVGIGSGAESTLANLGKGSLPIGALADLDGDLYGTTTGGGNGFGDVFSVDVSTGATKTVYTFKGGNDGVSPQGGLLADSGLLFGATQSGGTDFAGTIFQVDGSTGTKTTLYNFTGGDDGAYPNGGLIQVGTMLYGTAEFGGTNVAGVVFSINPATRKLRILHSFTGLNGPMTGDGADPVAGLTELGGTLYGTAQYGGTFAGSCAQSGCGIIYGIEPSTGAETILHAFTGGTDGAFPEGALIGLSEKLYGTTVGGGAYGSGALIEIDPKTGGVTTLYSFSGLSDGGSPASSLLNHAGTFYGTTNAGGPGNAGTVFSFVP